MRRRVRRAARGAAGPLRAVGIGAVVVSSVLACGQVPAGAADLPAVAYTRTGASAAVAPSPAPTVTPTETAKADAREDGKDGEAGKEKAEGNDGPQAGDPIPGSYIVRFAESSGLRGEAKIRKVARELTGRVGGQVKDVYTTVLRGFSAKLSAGQARRMARQPGVESVTQDVRVKAIAPVTDDAGAPVDDARASSDGVQTNGLQLAPPWHLDRLDQPTLPLSGTFEPGDASGAHIYVFDHGVRATHEEFGGRVKDGPAGTDHDDCEGHGTAVAGAAAGKTFGVAKNATIHRVRVLNCSGSAPATNALNAIEWVTESGPRPAVVNMSWGTGGGPDSPLWTAIQNSIRAGITYVAAAPNGGESCSVPARIPEVITVSAVDRTDRRSVEFTDPCIDLFAPGYQILTAAKDSDTATTVATGASFAAPLVAGAAAVYLSAHPDATPKQVTDALFACAGTGLVVDPGPKVPNRLLSTDCDGGALRVANPGHQITTKGRPVRISKAKVIGTGAGAFRYSATGLPAGVSIDAETGVISGTPAEAGATVAKITAADGESTASTTFAWDVVHGYGTIALADNRALCLDNDTSRLVEGNKVQLHDACGQIWLMDPGGRLVFQRDANDFCAAVSDKDSPDGPLVSLTRCSASATQVWEPRADGTLVNPATGKCLTAPRIGSGVQLTLAACEGGTGQKWHLPLQPAGNPLTINTPDGGVVTTLGGEVSMRLPVTSRDTTQSLRYSATGLPAGVSINPDTGIITGTIRPGQTTAVTVTVAYADGPGDGPSASASFRWQVADGKVIGVNGQCLDVDHGGIRDDTPVQLFSCNSGNGQLWSVRSDGRLEGRGSCLMPRGGATGAGTPVAIFSCSDAEAQVWRPGPDGTLRNVASGRCLTGPAGGGPGIQLTLADCKGGAAQIWTLPTDPAAGLFTVPSRMDLLAGKKVDVRIEGRADGYRVTGLPEGLSVDEATGRITGTPARVSAGEALITATGPDGVTGRGAFTWSVHQGQLIGPDGKCAGNENGDIRNGTKVVLAKCDDDAARRWTMRDDGALEVMGKCATVDKDATAHGSPIVIQECGPSPSQVWRPQADDTLRNPVSGRCLSGPVQTDSQQLILADCTAEKEQRWKLSHFDPPDPTPGNPPSRWGAPGGITNVSGSWCADSSDKLVIVWDCVESPTQTWRVNAKGWVLAQNWNKCLTPENNKTAVGTPILVEPCSDSNAAQEWRQRSDGTILNAASNLCLSSASFSRFARLALADCSAGDDRQRWKMPEAPKPDDPQTEDPKPGDLSPPGYGAPGEIRHVSGSWCVDSSGGNTIIWDCNRMWPQIWRVNSEGRVLSQQWSRCLAPEDNRTAAGTPVVVVPCSDSDEAQVWRQQPDGTVLNVASGRCLRTTSFGWTAPVVLADCSATDDQQQWRLPEA